MKDQWIKVNAVTIFFTEHRDYTYIYPNYDGGYRKIYIPVESIISMTSDLSGYKTALNDDIIVDSKTIIKCNKCGYAAKELSEEILEQNY